MENIDIKFSSVKVQKSAIIFRDVSASSCFIYLCYHCGKMFNEIIAH